MSTELIYTRTSSLAESVSTQNTKICDFFQKNTTIDGGFSSFLVEFFTALNQLHKAVLEKKWQEQPVEKKVLRILEESQESVRLIASKMSCPFFCCLLNAAREPVEYSDKNKLLVRSSFAPPIGTSHQEWYLNLGLLVNLYRRTSDPEWKKQLSFYAFNYLAKVSPISFDELSLSPSVESRLNGLFQFGFLRSGIAYNRESNFFHAYFQKRFQQLIADDCVQMFALVDSIDIEPLLSLRYTLLAYSSQNSEEALLSEWGSKIADVLIEHFKTQEGSDYLKKPFMLDFTDLLGDKIKTEGDRKKNKQFQQALVDLKGFINKVMDEALRKVPSLREESPRKLEVFVRSNLCCTCRIQMQEVGLLCFLPLFLDPKDYSDSQGEGHQTLSNKIDKQLAELDEFLSLTGIRLGSVRGRKALFDFMSLEDLIEQVGAQKVEFTCEGENVEAFERSSVTKSAVFKRLHKACKGSHDHLVLGRITTLLLKGLFDEIEEDQWKKLNQKPLTRQLIQTSIYRLLQPLAQAENHQKNPVIFLQSIELIQYEIAMLLDLFSLFSASDFELIYKKRLGHIPRKLQKFVQVGVSKSAMNLLAGMMTAVRAKKDPVIALDTKSHFESVGFLKEENALNLILDNKKVQHVDFYLADINYNVNLEPRHQEYSASSIILDVEAILKAKPETQHLTVAVDCTIDYIHSSKVEEMLQHFTPQILEGKLNFVFFRSGQKFDMVGLDHFYGAPFYIINSGASHWANFNRLKQSAAHQTDTLSQQWFCLVNKYAPKLMDRYRQIIFQNTRNILSQVPDSLKPGQHPQIQVALFSQGLETCFIDIRAPYSMIQQFENQLLSKFAKSGMRVHMRAGYGFFNTNLSVFRKGSVTTLRINPGLVSQEVDLIIEFLKELASS